MSDEMKPALIACAAALPLLFGVGWLADIITRDVVGMIMLSHGDDPRPIISQSILWQMWPALIAMWVVASGIVLCLAKAGLCGPFHPPVAPPPPPFAPPLQASAPKREARG